MSSMDIELLVADQPTAAGNKYPLSVLESIANAINVKPVTIEELSPIERKAKGQPICYSWPEHAMATSTKAVVVDGTLRVSFDVKNNKFGKLLMSTMESVGGQEKLVFMPVGIGDTDSDGVIKPGYAVQYVTFKDAAVK